MITFSRDLFAVIEPRLDLKYPPTAVGGISTVEAKPFTEQGVTMLSSVLSSERAVLVNVEIMRAFVKTATNARVECRTITAV